ncbi:hypothetical protein [Streptosporangium sp. NPDC051022]|uniref:hypothetical protein n=1 Tax=Streptosporangium sp. NPDC051022 TaxID=3155752 RepID=UPI00342398DE
MIGGVVLLVALLVLATLGIFLVRGAARDRDGGRRDEIAHLASKKGTAGPWFVVGIDRGWSGMAAWEVLVPGPDAVRRVKEESRAARDQEVYLSRRDPDGRVITWVYLDGQEVREIAGLYGSDGVGMGERCT